MGRPAASVPRLPAYEDIFGPTQRFEEVCVDAPRINGWRRTRSWSNRVLNYSTPVFTNIGNIHICYHGTTIRNIYKIASHSLLDNRRKRRFGRGGLFGNGIYVAPKAIKAFMHSPAHSFEKQCFRYLLKGRIALGRSFHPKVSRQYTQFWLQEKGYDSIHAQAGEKIFGIWGTSGSLSHSEIVVFNPEQVIIDHVFEYTEDGKTKIEPLQWPFLARKPKHPDRPFAHVCTKSGKACRFAFDTSGCIVKKKKLGVSSSDLEFCRDFKPSFSPTMRR